MKPKLHLVLGLSAFLVAVNMSSAATNEAVRVVSADLKQASGPLNTMFKRCVGAGRANEAMPQRLARQGLTRR